MLAQSLGMSVRQMLKTIDSREIAEWQVFMSSEYWEKRIKEKNMTASERANRLKSLMFGKAKVTRSDGNS